MFLGWAQLLLVSYPGEIPFFSSSVLFMKSQSAPSHVSLGVLKVCNKLEGLDLLNGLRGGLWMYSHSGDVCCISVYCKGISDSVQRRQKRYSQI